jgi:ABC-type sugar transport system ATPase subunit
MTSTQPLLEMRGIGKRFSGVVALEGVDFDVHHGEVHALVGENGAGKSTLIKVLTGAEQPDVGRIRFGGAAVEFASPRDAQAAGIATIYQEVTRIPALSVAENFFIGRQPRRWYGVDWRAMRVAARDRLARLGLDLDVTRPMGSFSVAVQQMVAIARALDLDARLLVMDEPTASLDRREVDELFALVAGLSSRGVATIFIGHRLEEVFRIADRITVLRNGRRVGSFRAQDVSRVELVSCMLGRELAGLTVRRGVLERPPALGATSVLESKPVLSVRALACGGALEPCDLDVRRGETVGVAGLLGSGRSELLRAIFGADRPSSGAVDVAGAVLATGRVRDSIACGLAYCPEERQVDGLLPGLSVWENIALVLDRNIAVRSPARQRQIAEALVQRLSIACADSAQPARTLSGGNQQKVILARWLAARPAVFLLDEPTRGIDVGGKVEIELLIRELAAEGRGVLWVSSSLDELLQSSDRLIVMHALRKVAELGTEAIREDDVVRAMSGVEVPAEAPAEADGGEDGRGT